jgi:phosphatidylserine/phosphatidylglycerophosphate/cardiolipin synthase-like enzyme
MAERLLGRPHLRIPADRAPRQDTFDNRSLSFNDEVCLLALDERIGSGMARMFVEDCGRAREIVRESFRRRPLRLRLLEQFGYRLWRWL